MRGQFLKPEEGSYGHISEGFILAEFYLLRVSIQNLGEWLTCDLAFQVNSLLRIELFKYTGVKLVKATVAGKVLEGKQTHILSKLSSV